MHELARGQRLKLDSLLACTLPFTVDLRADAPFALDFACFGVGANGKLHSDPYLVFYNQLSTPCAGVKLALAAQAAQFTVRLDALPTSIDRLVFTATVDGNGMMSALAQATVVLAQPTSPGARFVLQGSELQQQKALLLAEVYRKDGSWRFATLGEGFNGGLSALLAHFGGDEAPAVPAAAAPAPVVSLSKAVRLEKELAQKAPRLVSLVKAAHVSLDKQGLSEHAAKVCLVLDVSGSMVALYRRGVVQQITERLLALACLFDDDKAIDVFLFDSRAIAAGEISINNFDGAVDRLIAQHKLGGGTDYAPVMNLVRQFYAKARGDLPVYVLFVTDGAPGDRSASQKTVREASREPLFWQFVGVGGSRFDFLEKLDDLKDRFIDNADFFAIPDPSKLSDPEMYKLLLQEYPGWLQAARQKGLLTR